MRIGFTELVLLFIIASVAVGPAVVRWVNRWLHRAERSYAAAARREAARRAAAAAEREIVLRRFQRLGILVLILAAVSLVYALVFRPIDAEAAPYTAPLRRETAAVQSAVEEQLSLGGYQAPSCVRERDGWVYFTAADTKGGSVLARMNADGSGLASILTVEGEITSFDFDAAGEVWFTTVTPAGGALYKARYDGWGAATEQVVGQIDGKALSCPAAVTVDPEGRVYFTNAAAAPAEHGAQAALRTELLAHTATGWVYVYDPAVRAVQRVLGGLAGASGLALSPEGDTLYVSDLGSRCIWAVPANARELTAGGKGCAQFAAGLPGYPGSLTVDEEGCLYVAYCWAPSGWLEARSGGTLVRGAALRLSQKSQQKLVGLPSSSPSAEVLAPDGTPLRAFLGRDLGSASAICPAGSRVYLGTAGQDRLYWTRV